MLVAFILASDLAVLSTYMPLVKFTAFGPVDLSPFCFRCHNRRAKGVKMEKVRTNGLVKLCHTLCEVVVIS